MRCLIAIVFGAASVLLLMPLAPSISLEDMGTHQHRQHAFSLVSLDEAHATHISGQVVDHARTLSSGTAGLQQGKVGNPILHAGGLLIPLLERLHVDGADLGVATLLQDADQMAADETTGTSNDNEIIFRH